MSLIFCDWDGRPAVLVDDVAAFAVLMPEGLWESVDFWDVYETAGMLPEEAWRSKFEGKFGSLDLSALPSASQVPPLSPGEAG